MAVYHPIPQIYRLTFNYLEPLFAISGAIQMLLFPQAYLRIANPNAYPHYTTHLQTIFTQVAGGWLLLAFNDAVTLRAFSHDVKVWRYVLMAHLLSDIVYCCALAQDLSISRFCDPRLWTVEDWVTMGATIPALLVKVAFLLGWGIRGEGRAGRKGGKRQ